MTPGNAGYERKPPAAHDLMLLESPEFTADTGRKLIAFNMAYQIKGLCYFAGLKLQWERDNRGRVFPGLCAEVDSVTGRFRASEDQRAWSWGDTRAVGLWCYFLKKGVIPEGTTTVRLSGGETVDVDLRVFFEQYVDHIFTQIESRFFQNEGKIPFLIDPLTGKPSDDPRNIHPASHEFIGTHVFAINAFFQYGILRGRSDAIELGLRVLKESLLAARENRFIHHLTRERTYAFSHGREMTTVGAVVDTLKTLDLLERSGDFTRSGIRELLITTTRWAVDLTLGYYWDAERNIFSEYLDPITMTRFIDDAGRVICDPGHTAEAAGFYAELSQYLPEDDSTIFRFSRKNMIPVLCDIIRFVHENGFSDKGVMFKNIDVISGQGVFDANVDGVQRRTAPWWNLRELSAAAIRLYALTGDASMWETYRKAHNATYRNYPNESIGGLMVQTLDADTLHPLPYHPATGNLDPMHSPRAREREIEALEDILTRQEAL